MNTHNMFNCRTKQTRVLLRDLIHFQGNKSNNLVLASSQTGPILKGMNCPLNIVTIKFSFLPNFLRNIFNKRQKDCLWKYRTHYGLENESLGFI